MPQNNSPHPPCQPAPAQRARPSLPSSRTTATNLLVAVVHYCPSLIVLSSAAIKRQFSAALNSRNCECEQFRGFFLRDSRKTTTTKSVKPKCQRVTPTLCASPDTEWCIFLSRKGDNKQTSMAEEWGQEVFNMKFNMVLISSQPILFV